jgi:hypothetical protein
MIRIAKNTRLTPEEVIDKASGFFGSAGQGLEEKERGLCCISFEGGGGYVTVSVAELEGRRMVDVESREFEYQTKGFMNIL